MTSMVPPWGVLPVRPVASTTKFEEGVDGGPWGVLPAGPAASTTEFEGGIDDGTPGGIADGSGSIHH
jgi:hypothetical protein